MTNPLMFLLAAIDLVIAYALFRIANKANRRGISAIGAQLAVLCLFCALFGIVFMILSLIPDGALKPYTL